MKWRELYTEWEPLLIFLLPNAEIDGRIWIQKQKEITKCHWVNEKRRATVILSVIKPECWTSSLQCWHLNDDSIFWNGDLSAFLGQLSNCQSSKIPFLVSKRTSESVCIALNLLTTPLSFLSTVSVHYRLENTNSAWWTAVLKRINGSATKDTC